MTGKQEENRIAAKAERAVPRESAQNDQPKKLLDGDLAAVAGGYPRSRRTGPILPRPDSEQA